MKLLKEKINNRRLKYIHARLTVLKYECQMLMLAQDLHADRIIKIKLKHVKLLRKLEQLSPLNSKAND